MPSKKRLNFGLGCAYNLFSFKPRGMSKLLRNFEQQLISRKFETGGLKDLLKSFWEVLFFLSTRSLRNTRHVTRNNWPNLSVSRNAWCLTLQHFFFFFLVIRLIIVRYSLIPYSIIPQFLFYSSPSLCICLSFWNEIYRGIAKQKQKNSRHGKNARDDNKNTYVNLIQKPNRTLILLIC